MAHGATSLEAHGGGTGSTRREALVIDAFLGLKVVVSEHARRITITEERLFPASRHRSARIYKKLLKRYGGEFKVKFEPISYQIGNTLVVHPTIHEEMKRRAAQSRHS